MNQKGRWLEKKFQGQTSSGKRNVLTSYIPRVVSEEVSSTAIMDTDTA